MRALYESAKRRCPCDAYFFYFGTTRWPAVALYAMEPRALAVMVHQGARNAARALSQWRYCASMACRVTSTWHRLARHGLCGQWPGKPKHTANAGTTRDVPCRNLARPEARRVCAPHPKLGTHSDCQSATNGSPTVSPKISPRQSVQFSGSCPAQDPPCPAHLHQGDLQPFPADGGQITPRYCRAQE